MQLSLVLLKRLSSLNRKSHASNVSKTIQEVDAHYEHFKTFQRIGWARYIVPWRYQHNGLMEDKLTIKTLFGY